MKRYSEFVVLVVVLGLVAAGCGDNKSKTDNEEQKKKDKKDEVGHSSPDGWWCNEHGIPEKECSMCSGAVEKACKAKDDWCEKHNRAKSQCFKCDPKLKKQFADRYEAKYGKKPPEPTE